MDCGLKFISQSSMRFAGQVAYHRYEGLVHKDEEGPRLIADLGDKHVMFLENHGTLITGRSIPECFLLQPLHSNAPAKSRSRQCRPAQR